MFAMTSTCGEMILPGSATRSHCEGAFFTTEAIFTLARRWLHYVRHDRHLRGSDFARLSRQEPLRRSVFLRLKQSPHWLGDGFTTFAMTGTCGEMILPGSTARSHCKEAFFGTEAISTLARRWLHYVRHDKHLRGNDFARLACQESLRRSVLCD